MKAENPETKQKKNACGVCEALGAPPPCRGHAKTGGGGGGGSTEESGKTSDSTLGISVGQSQQLELTPANILVKEWNDQLKMNIGSLRFEAGFFKVECDNLHGILTLQINPDLSKEDNKIAQEILQKIKMEFDLFKESLQEKNISVSQLSAIIENGTLTIKIPNPKYFSEFIQRLAEKNLLPSLSHQQDHNNELREKPTRKPLSPFNMTMKPRPKNLLE